MGGAGVWGGLRRSAFLADLTARDRDPARIAATVNVPTTSSLTSNGSTSSDS